MVAFSPIHMWAMKIYTVNRVLSCFCAGQQAVKAFVSVLFFCAFLLLFPMSVGQAQSLLVVDKEVVSASFPDTITFQADVQSLNGAEIEKATLIYGTNGRFCQNGGSRQQLSFDQAEEVSLEWEWELKRSGSLPPGVTVWWQWEIENTAGDKLLTERQEQMIIDERFSWKRISDNGIVVHWIEGDDQFGQSLLETADASLVLLAENMGAPRPESISLWVYPDSAGVQDALVYSPEWAGGIAFPTYGISILGIAPGQDAWQEQVIPHELAHLVVGTIVFNCAGASLPTWLNEGLARYAERDIDQSDLDQLALALAEERLPTLRSQSNGFSAYGGSASLSYTQSYVMVKYLIESFGPEKMSLLLTTVQSGASIDEALFEVYQADTDGLDAQWRGEIGYEATPTTEAEALAAASTPTAVPTLSLSNPLEGIASPIPASATPLPTTATVAPTEIPVPEAENTLTPPPTIEVMVDVDETAVPDNLLNGDPEGSTNPLILWGVAAVGILLLLIMLIATIRTQRNK